MLKQYICRNVRNDVQNSAQRKNLKFTNTDRGNPRVYKKDIRKNNYLFALIDEGGIF